MRILTLDKYGLPVFIILVILVGLVLGFKWADSIRVESTPAPTCTHTTIDKYLECR